MVAHTRASGCSCPKQWGRCRCPAAREIHVHNLVLIARALAAERRTVAPPVRHVAYGPWPRTGYGCLGVGRLPRPQQPLAEPQTNSRSAPTAHTHTHVATARLELARQLGGYARPRARGRARAPARAHQAGDDGAGARRFCRRNTFKRRRVPVPSSAIAPLNIGPSKHERAGVTPPTEAAPSSSSRPRASGASARACAPPPSLSRDVAVGSDA